MAKVVRGDGKRFQKTDEKLKSSSAKVIVEKNVRFIPNRFQALSYLKKPRQGIAKQIEMWIQGNDDDHYLGFGGLGDALLVLAACWNNPRAKVAFFANGGSIDIMTQFFKLFKIPHLIAHNIMGSAIAPGIQDMIQSHPNFKISGHLADNCDYGDWTNEGKYINRIVNKTSWLDFLGSQPNAYDTKGVIVIAPHGSVRDYARQRFLSRNEYNSLVNNFISQNYTVYCVGSGSDFEFYGQPLFKNQLWITTDSTVDFKGVHRPNTLHIMLQMINSADHVYSMDTWLKTYSLLVNLPTTVIKTRWNGKYMPYGTDITDWIFLNDKIWPSIKMATIEELL